METIIQRAKSPTPTFFKKLRNIALILTAVSGAILTAPVALPAALVTAAGYVAVAGSIAAGVSQLTSKADKKEQLSPTPAPPLPDSSTVVKPRTPKRRKQ